MKAEIGIGLYLVVIGGAGLVGAGLRVQDEPFVTAPVSSERSTSSARLGTPLWFPVVVFLGIALVLFVTVQVSHDHFSLGAPSTDLGS